MLELFNMSETETEIDIKCFTVMAGSVLVFKMTRQPDGSWVTIHGPKTAPKRKKPKKPKKTGKMAAMRRQHQRWLNR